MAISLTRGVLVRYREWYGAAAPNVGLKMTAEAVGAGIVERELNDPTLRYGVLDPACFKEDPRSRSGSTRSLLRLVCGHFTPQTIPASRTGDQWGAGISCAPA